MALWIYLIGLGIAIAITEETSKQTDSINFLIAVIWPIILCAIIIACILWPPYCLTKKLINYLKHIKWLKM